MGKTWKNAIVGRKERKLMKYNNMIGKPDPRGILDDSRAKQALNIIEQLLGRKLNLDIRSEREMVELLDYPERFIKDKDTIEEIRNLKELIIEMSGI
jgi:hypothetical protein